MPTPTLHISPREIPLFRDVDDETAKRFIASGYSFTYSAGTPIVINDDNGATFFMMLSGLARIVLLSDKNEQINVMLLKPGEFFGELAILENEMARTANVIAATDVEVIALQRNEFMKLMKEYPQLALNLARGIGNRLRSMNEKLMAMTLPPPARVAKTLLNFAAHGKAFSEDGPILLPGLPLKEWIMFCSVTSDQFMSIMEDLRNSGAIEWQNQRVVVKDLNLLAAKSRISN